jgi:hypothetical protein
MLARQRRLGIFPRAGLHRTAGLLRRMRAVGAGHLALHGALSLDGAPDARR